MEMTPAPISVERYTVTGDIAYPIHEDTNGEYVRHSDYTALLHQLAERDAEVARLLRGVSDMSDRFNETAADLRAAERARDGMREQLRIESALLLAWERESREGGWSTHQVDPMKRRAGEIDAFLAASGGK